MPRFVCENCGGKQKKWVGKCPNCDSWNSLTEDNSIHEEDQKVSLSTYHKHEDTNVDYIEIFNLSDINTKAEERIISKIDELDNILGGGFVKGSAILIGGEPGIGKSTILLQIIQSITQKQDKQIMYVSGEESVSQIAMRADRLGISKDMANRAHIISSGSVFGIIGALKTTKVDFLLIDSIQTMFVSNVESSPGTVAQIRASGNELVSFCKAKNIVLIMIGHVTKEGVIAGPKLLEHMVDVVIYFEGDSDKQFRILRSVKNRFGPVNEIGVFAMEQNGLVEVRNPSVLFSTHHEHKKDVIFVAREGSRCVLVTVESLIARSFFPSPRRSVVGWDHNRLAMILAIMQTYCNLHFQDKDVYLSMAGGFKTMETANDLATFCSIAIATMQVTIKVHIVAIGEISLSGDVRSTTAMEARVRESRRLGYKFFILPKNYSKIVQTKETGQNKELHDKKNQMTPEYKDTTDKIEMHYVSTVGDVIRLLKNISVNNRD